MTVPFDWGERPLCELDASRSIVLGHAFLPGLRLAASGISPGRRISTHLCCVLGGNLGGLRLFGNPSRWRRPVSERWWEVEGGAYNVLPKRPAPCSRSPAAI